MTQSRELGAAPLPIVGDARRCGMIDLVGEPITLTNGGCRADIHPALGGRLGQLDLGDGPLLRGPAEGLGWIQWGCYPLLPWSNRLPGGHLRYRGIDADLPPNNTDRSPIHGLAAAIPWRVVDAGEDRVDLSVDVRGGPYDVRGSLSYDLEPGILHLRLAVTNLGAAVVPAGIGIHPWFRRGPIRVPADARWPGEPIPTGPPVPVSGDHDLRSATVAAPMDACFTALTGSCAGVPGARLCWDGPVTHVVVYTGEPDWVCVEPVTMVNNGIAMADRGAAGHGVQEMASGASIEVRYRFERMDDGPRAG